MRNPSPQQLLEIDRCFQYVLEHISEDGVYPRNVLFGSTIDNWFRSLTGGQMKIVIGGSPPNAGYETAYLGSN